MPLRCNELTHSETTDEKCQVPPPVKTREGTYPEGDRREFSEDGCFVAPYFYCASR